MAVWDENIGVKADAPEWLLTGHMLLWNDGSPAHVDMSPFKSAVGCWEADVMVSRSAMQGTRWLTLRMRMTPAVRNAWDSEGTSARARALQVLANYLKLTEWYEDDLGVLELR